MATKALDISGAVPADKAGNAPPDLLRLAAAENSAFIAEWDDLAVNASEPNIFYESWYLLPSLRGFGPDISLFVPCIDGEIIGLLPLAFHSHYGRWPVPNVQNWQHPNIFLGTPLIRKGREGEFWQALLAHLDARPGRALFLHIDGMASDGAAAKALEDLCQSQKRRHALVQQSERAYLQSDLGAEEYYLQTMRGKKRKELRRQKKRLEELGALTFMRSDGSAGLTEWTEEFLALELAGWKGKEGSALACDGATRQLFCDTLSGAAARGQLQLLDLRLDGKPLAMLVNFISGEGSFSFKTSFDEDYARFSPGVLLQIENLALLDNPAIAWSDSCAAAGHPMIDSVWAQRRKIGRYSVAIGGAGRRMLFNGYLSAELARARKRAELAAQTAHQNSKKGQEI